MRRSDNRPYRWVAAVAVLLALAGCGEPPSLNGVVRDNFGQPLADVVVSIPGTEFTATSDVTGAYRLSFAPGELTLSFVRPGYQNENVIVSAPRGGQVPVDEVVLHKSISRPGIFVVGKTNYIGPLNVCQINILMVRDNVEFGYDRITAGGVDPALIDLADVRLPAILVENADPLPATVSEPLRILYERYDSPEIGRVTFRAAPEVTSREIDIRPIENGARFGRWYETDIRDVGTFALVIADPANRLPRPGALCYLFQFR